VDAEARLVELVHVQAACLAAAVRPRLPKAGRYRHRDPALAAGRDLELAAFGDRALMDVPGHDQLRACVDERREHVVSTRNRSLPRAPRCADQMVVENRDAELGALD
jgi:hypothetical protein